jgi:hypothetical protein
VRVLLSVALAAGILRLADVGPLVEAFHRARGLDAILQQAIAAIK